MRGRLAARRGLARREMARGRVPHARRRRGAGRLAAPPRGTGGLLPRASLWITSWTYITHTLTGKGTVLI